MMYFQSIVLFMTDMKLNDDKNRIPSYSQYT